MILHAAGLGGEVPVLLHRPSAEAALCRAKLSDLTTVVPVHAVPTPIDPTTRRRAR